MPAWLKIAAIVQGFWCFVATDVYDLPFDKLCCVPCPLDKLAELGMHMWFFAPLQHQAETLFEKALMFSITEQLKSCFSLGRTISSNVAPLENLRKVRYNKKPAVITIFSQYFSTWFVKRNRQKAPGLNYGGAFHPTKHIKAINESFFNHFINQFLFLPIAIKHFALNKVLETRAIA